MPARHHLISAAAFLLAVLAAGVAPALAQDRTEPAGTGVTGDGRPGGGDSEGSGGDSQGGDSGEPAALGATGGGAPAPTATTGDLPRERVQQVQERLAAAGFDPGPADGAMGPRTRAALRAFQEARGLDPTGEPDGSTLAELGAE
jgi:peptidoglycan hydrolase-like protein with peptidoglycan-binding domain